MAVEIIVKNVPKKGLFKKKRYQLSPASLIKDTKNKYYFGIKNHAMVFEDYDGNPKAPFVDTSLIIVDKSRPFGRGLNLYLGADQSEYHLSLNLPATTNDCISFYEFLTFLLDKTGSMSFIEEGNEYQKSDIENLKNNLIEANHTIIKNQNIEGFILFGARYPIFIEDDARLRWETMEGAALEESFSQYLHEKQDHDFYYMKPNFYSREARNASDEILGIYAFTEDVNSVIPIKPYVPFGFSLDGEVSRWLVNLVAYDGSNYKVIGEIPYDVFLERLNKGKVENFDREHLIVKGHTKEELEYILIDMLQ